MDFSERLQKLLLSYFESDDNISASFEVKDEAAIAYIMSLVEQELRQDFESAE